MENTGFSEINAERLHFKGPGFWFAEIVITGQCNFNCKYCNRLKSKINLDNIYKFISDNDNGLRHIQLTGGEPTLYPNLIELCDFIKSKNIRLGISTNGSADYNLYEKLNADMFSISLDDYDESILYKRGYKGIAKIKDNIQRLSKEYYVNIGLIIDSLNCLRAEIIIEYILKLGAKDIKLSINTKDEVIPEFSNKDYSAYPILNYRINRFRSGNNMRGILKGEHFRCGLVKNDISIVGNKHYPCLVYAREGGKAIGELNNNVESARDYWYRNNEPYFNPICKKFCMDFKCEFNREYQKLIER